jgi:hypothetical protein
MIYEQIIHNLSEIIGNNKTSENVYNTFVFAEKAIQNKEVVLEINPKINPEIDSKMADTILGGMYVREGKSGIINLVFGKKYLDTYNKNSSIHYTVGAWVTVTFFGSKAQIWVNLTHSGTFCPTFRPF